MTDMPANAPAFEFDAPLSVCVDVKHPQVYLALGPVRALGDELGVTIDWLPFPAPPMKPPPAPAADRGTRHRRVRARYQEMDLLRYAAAQGLTLRDPYRREDSTLASLGLLWLRERAPHQCAEYLRRTCAGLWAGALDIESAAALGRILSGLDERPQDFLSFVAGRGPEALAQLRERLVAAGVFGVPSLVVEGEVFVGRAHLPMVRWRLTGRNGPPPI